MASKWLRTTVADVAKHTATGPFGSAISSKHFIDVGVPVIRGSNLSQDVSTRLNDTGLVFVSEDKASEFSRSEARIGDLVFTCWGTIDQVGLIDERAKYRRYIVSNKQMLLRPDASKADSLFLYYYFASPEIRTEIVNRGIGSSVPGFNLGQLRAFEIPLPPLPEQKAIARILGTLDDKIELNRRMNATLEAMARALFQSWFVDFDPVHAKAAGRQPSGMDAKAAALFPAAFQDSELSKIPKGWNVKTIGETIELAYGKPLKEENRRGGCVAVFGSNGRVGWHDEKLVTGPGIVVGRKGNPGIVTWAPGDFYPIDTTFYVMPVGECKSLYFLYYALSLQNLASLGADSAVPGLNRNHAYMSKLIIPSSKVLNAFDEQIAPLFLRINANDHQSRTLATLRDTLLPKLLSGDFPASFRL
ncbi:MAG: restriction endonuclease subunit S [Verrucomicrobia bacterium]|nr:restriction endonuclease subunit S [Verrucomicrobiota bacterium]